MLTRTEHLLSCLAEECAEVAQVCSKALRFGLTDVNVVNPQEGPNCLRIMAVAEMLREAGLIPDSERARRDIKKMRVRHFMLYAIGRGALKDEGGSQKEAKGRVIGLIEGDGE